MKTKSFIVSFIVAFSVSCSSFKRQATADLTGNMLIPYGRCLQGQGGLELISSASHFGFTFTGKACQVTAYLSDAQGHNYLQYEIDGTYEAKKIKIIGDKHQTFTLSVPHEGTHTVWIYKATEAHTGPIYIKHIQGSSLQAIAKPKAPLIEFIGNSITCGAAADPDEVPCGTGAYHDQHNAYQAYGPRLARKLGVHYVLSSVSGIGVYRNWNSEGPTMPQVYEKADFQEQGTRAWDFARFTPDIVSISLGTNDFSGGDGKKRRLPFDSGSFV
ncbi:MAG TPA: GDSL-type esterase/lipase family protein, partial [Cytophagales bacterium]|nr:GDSL-type esterase/lipase family protein [Cytophagales bacterium]